MGLCFETLRQERMAGESYRQAWKTLLEQRAVRKKSKENEKGEALRHGARGDGGGGDSRKEEGSEKTLKGVGGDGGAGGGAGGGGGGDDDGDDDEIGMILLQAKVALTTVSDGTSRDTSAAGSGWSRDSTPQQQRFEGGVSGSQTVGGRPSNLDR